MDKNRLLNLLARYQSNLCTEDELQELEQWYSSLNSANEPVEMNDAVANEMLTQFRSILKTASPVVPFYRRKIFRIAAAAAIIILIVTTGVLIMQSKENNIGTITTTNGAVDISAPNSTKAYITLSDNRKIYLDSVANGTIVSEGNVTITKTEDGKIIYNPGNETEVRMNVLTLPKGSKPFRVQLADGSEMWLDAATTVTYPNVFVGKERKVEVNMGQVYFEVAPQPQPFSIPIAIGREGGKLPFIVKKGDVEVTVLGTHFNVSAFDGEEMKVTLLEGSVEVKSERSNVKIKPGEQTVTKMSGELSVVSGVDTDAVMAWKNGNFQFEGADISQVMKQLARWYDVEVEIQGNIPAHFGGTISRDVSVSKVFEMLKLTGELNYKIEGRKIIVSP